MKYIQVTILTLALGALLNQDGYTREVSQTPHVPPDGLPHFEPKAKSVIYLYMDGGPSQIDTFDPKRVGDPKTNKPGWTTSAGTAEPRL